MITAFFSSLIPIVFGNSGFYGGEKTGKAKHDWYNSNKQGFSLIEVLIVLSLMGAGTAALVQLFEFQLKSVNKIQSHQSEADFRQVLRSMDNSACRETFNGKNIGDSIVEFKDGSGTVFFKVSDQTFERFEIIKMETRQKNGASNPTIGYADMVFYFKRVGTFVDKEGGVCSNTDQSGCFKRICKLKLAPTNTGATGDPVGNCELLSCGGQIVSKTSTPCYEVDDQSKRTLIGCGTTTDNGKSETLALGYNAGSNRLSGEGNIFIGHESGEKATTARYNTFIGYEAGEKATTAEHNTFIGYGTGKTIKTGYNNTHIGSTAGAISTGVNNTFVGAAAGRWSSGGSNTYVGTGAGGNSPNQTGARNTFVGEAAGYLNIGGSSNVFLGTSAGNNNLNGEKNTFVGHEAGFKNTGGIDNIFVGHKAGYKNTVGRSNVFVGLRAGHDNTVGNRNTFVGEGAGSNNTTGQDNTYLGFEAGVGQPNGAHDNVIIKAGTKTITRLKSKKKDNSLVAKILKPFIETKSRKTKSEPGSNNILIGSFSTEKERELLSRNSSYLWIQGLIEGNAEERWVAINNTLETHDLYASLNSPSDRRLKKNITALEGVSSIDLMNRLEPVSFQWRDSDRSDSSQRHFGFIAQEVQTVVPEVIREDREGFLAINYPELIPMIVSGLKKLFSSMNSNEDRMTRIEEKMFRLETENRLLKEQIEKMSRLETESK